VTSGVERVDPADIQIGDRIQYPSGTGSITVARISSAVIGRQVGHARDATTVFEFEDGEEGQVVWTFRETELVTRQVFPGS
jgi:hypothetical protein